VPAVAAVVAVVRLAADPPAPRRAAEALRARAVRAEPPPPPLVHDRTDAQRHAGTLLDATLSDTRRRVVTLIDMVPSAKTPGERYRIQRELRRLLARRGSVIDADLRERLLAMLDTVAPEQRPVVMTALAGLRGDERVAAALLERLRNKPGDPDVHDVLARLGVPTIVPDLLAMLGEGRSDEPLLVATIGSLGGHAAARHFLASLDWPLRADTRAEIVRVLGGMNDAALLDEAARRLEHSSPVARRSLLAVLGSSSDPSHATAVRALLGDESDVLVRRTAIGILGRFGDEESGRLLLDLLSRGDAHERACAADAIGRIRDAGTVAMLATRWDGMGGDGRRAVLEAGAALQAPGAELLRIAAGRGLRDREMRVRVASARLLGRPNRDEHTDALASHLERAAHPTEQVEVLRALERIGTREAVARALDSLNLIRDRRYRDEWRMRLQHAADARRDEAVATVNVRTAGPLRAH